MTGQGRAPCEVLKVAAASKPVSVAGAIAGVIRTQSRVEIHAIGAAAVNQAVGDRYLPRLRRTSGTRPGVHPVLHRLVARWAGTDRDQTPGGGALTSCPRSDGRWPDPSGPNSAPWGASEALTRAGEWRQSEAWLLDPGYTRRDHHIQFVRGCMLDRTYSGVALAGQGRTSRQPRC